MPDFSKARHPASSIRFAVTAALFFSGIASAALGQQRPPSSSADTARGYRYDLERYLYPTPEAEASSRSRLTTRLKALEAARASAGTSAASLLEALVLMDSAAAEAKRHSTYLYLRTQTNTLDRASAEAQSAIDAQATSAARAFRTTLQRIDPRRLEQFIKDRPALEAYRFVLTSARRYAAHTVEASGEQILSRVAPLASDWPLELYDRAMARIDFGTVPTAGGSLDVYRQRGAIAASPDTAVRNAGNRLLWAGFNSQRDLFAMAVVGNVRSRNALAKERHFDDASAESYYRAYLTTDDVRTLIARIRSRAELSKRYQRILATHAQWARAQPRRAPTTRVGISVDSASRLIAMAFASLGPDVEREVIALLDPKNGRLDVNGGLHRAGGGASFGASVVESGVYLSVFEGFPGDVSRLAHEVAHAVENQFQFAGHISPAYANGTANMVGADFLSEAYAQFGQLILADTLLKRSTTDTERQTYLVQFLTSAMELFYGAQDAELEQAIYDKVATEGGGTASQLDSVTARVDLAYDITAESRPELRARWIQKRVMIEDPVYYFNYMYSGILSLKLFERFSVDRASFVPRYVELVRRGYRMPPSEAVRRALGIELASPTLLGDVTGLIEKRVNELEALFMKQESRTTAPAP